MKRACGMACFALLMMATPAYAYLPVELGAGAAGSVFGIFTAFALLLVGAVYYPIKKIIKWIFRR